MILSPLTIPLTGSLPTFEKVGRAHGFSFFLPVKSGYDDTYYPDDSSYLYHPFTDFMKNTGWDKAIKHLVS